MLTVEKFSASEDCVVISPFDNYKAGDIVPANKIAKTRLVSLWIKKKVKNLNTPEYTRSGLENKSFNDLKKIGSEYGVKARSKQDLIDSILEMQ